MDLLEVKNISKTYGTGEATVSLVQRGESAWEVYNSIF